MPFQYYTDTFEFVQHSKDLLQDDNFRQLIQSCDFFCAKEDPFSASDALFPARKQLQGCSLPSGHGGVESGQEQAGWNLGQTHTGLGSGKAGAAILSSRAEPFPHRNKAAASPQVLLERG